MSSTFLSVSISAGKKKNVYFLNLCLEHADNIYVLKKVYEGVTKLRNIFNL